MREWINEHRKIFICLIAGIVAVAVISAAAVVIHNKNSNKPSAPAGTVNADEKTDEQVEKTQSASDGIQSQIESSDVTNITPSVSESEFESKSENKFDSKTEKETDIKSESKIDSGTGKKTEAKTERSTRPQTTRPVPTEVKSLADGNKTVYYPVALGSETKKYPVIVWANGTLCATDTYDKLLTEISKGGYIVVADSSVMTADGTAQIDSIDYIIGKNSDTGSIFCGKVDTEKIGAAGHSQGGRSAVNAAQNDGRIKCIVSIAGSPYKEEAEGLKASALYLTGTADMVVLSSEWCKPAYDAAAGRAVYASLKGGVHTTCITDPEKVSGYAVSWFDAYLKNDSASKAKFQNGGELSKDSAWQDFASKN